MTSLAELLRDKQFRSDVGDNARDFFQSASNTAASNVTAPVDGLAWLLRKAGVNVPQSPIGGSDWAQNAGLMAEPKNKNSLASLLGDAAGNIAPILGYAKAPEIAGGLNQLIKNANAPTPFNNAKNGQLGAVVWHGSPHKFDKFDASKIGTGEGAQAYGHGLYLAENPAVAQSYKTAGVTDNFGSTAERATEALYSVMDKLSDGRVLYGPNRSAITKDDLLREVQRSASDVYGSLPPLKQKMADAYGRTEGSLYKVDLPDNAISRMLNWDADIGSQPIEVQKALAKMRGVAPDLQSQLMKADPDKFNKTGQQFYKDMNASLFRQGNGAAGRASAALSEQGIPGIRYLDAMSRNGGGTSNYVVFPGNESLLKILSRE
jgi:hypothetical protein